MDCQNKHHPQKVAVVSVCGISTCVRIIADDSHQASTRAVHIMAYGSTPYVGMIPKKHGQPH